MRGQLTDWKRAAEVEQIDRERMAIYRKLCVWALERAHSHKLIEASEAVSSQLDVTRPAGARPRRDMLLLAHGQPCAPGAHSAVRAAVA
jgi:hypothetical protein